MKYLERITSNMPIAMMKIVGYVIIIGSILMYVAAFVILLALFKWAWAFVF